MLCLKRCAFEDAEKVAVVACDIVVVARGCVEYVVDVVVDYVEYAVDYVEGVAEGVVADVAEGVASVV